MTVTFFQQRNQSWINVKDYGAQGNGVTDDTLAITAALNAANTAGGATVFFPSGTYITGPQTLYSNMHLIGAEVESTIIKLKNGANADLLSANTNMINLSSAWQTGNNGGVYLWSLRNLTLDGNKANQTSGISYVLRFYGYSFTWRNTRVQNGYSGGILQDWNGTTPSTYYQDDGSFYVEDIKVRFCNGIGWEMGGPHDGIITDFMVHDTTSHNIHLAPNAAGMQFLQGDVYGSTHGNNAIAIFNETTSCMFSGVQVAGSDVCQVYFANGGNNWNGGRIFTLGQNAVGIQIGQAAGLTPYNGAILQSGGVTTAVGCYGCMIFANMANNNSTNGSIYLANDAGRNTVICNPLNSSPGKYLTGSRSNQSFYLILGGGLTADGTFGNSGGMIVQGIGLRSGTFAGIKSNSVQSLSNGNTITTLGVNMARVGQTSGAVTGIILQQGSFDSQQCFVVNEGSNTVTFDVSGTSHVAAGTSTVIAANSSRLFVYDTSTSLWY